MTEELKVDLVADDETLRKIVEEVQKAHSKEGTVGGMAPDEFMQLIVRVVNERALITARDEAVRSDRIFEDVEGLRALTIPPWRITTVQELEGLVGRLKAALTKKTHLVMAVCIVNHATYSPVKLCPCM